MYSGTTLRPLSGKMVGAHQKIDRLARAGLRTLLPNDGRFPSTRLILHFEGVNGPDAIKRKSPAKDEPWHYYSPFDEEDTRLIDIISGHYDKLVESLKGGDEVRAAFEAAWLAHAIVDGLTPAHHYPYEEKLTEIRGEGIETRTTIKEKIIMPGSTPRELLANNWKMWGPKGLLTSHGFFEFGVAFMLLPLGSRRVPITEDDISELHEHGALSLFRLRAKEIAALNAYETYVKYGWTPQLARMVRMQIIPAIIKTVALTWYAAAIDAGIANEEQA
ncbi:hypothetical protein IRY61_02225 [Candidatus Saccharibacteria bacterium]|jgi:hypothetical protein|nr:hypothetical protein [Candidatus Saccharibacteria bacterium]